MIDYYDTLPMNAGQVDYATSVRSLFRDPRAGAWNTTKPLGIDVSSHQGAINWDKVKAAGVIFVSIRATIGLRVDTMFSTNWMGAARVGLLRNAYHALVPNRQIGEQVELFQKTIGSERGELPPIWDCERTDGVSQREIVVYAQRGLEESSLWYGDAAVLYSSEMYLELLFGKAPEWVNNYPLHLARYLLANPATGYADEHPGPIPLPAWIDRENVYIHQTAGKGRGSDYGVTSKQIDLDRYQFDLASLRQWAGQGDVPQPMTLEEITAWIHAHEEGHATLFE